MLLQIKKLVEHVYSSENLEIDGEAIPVHQNCKPVVVGPATFELDDEKLASPVNQWILDQAFYMVTACRFTGNTQVLAKYQGQEITNEIRLHLPVMSEASAFSEFLHVVKDHTAINSICTKQHEGSLPKETKEISRLCMLLEALADPGIGCRKISRMFGDNGVAGESRVAMKRKIMTLLAECGDLQDEDQSAFVSHKILADLATAFLGVVGEPMIDSIHLGWGSSQGIDCLKIPGLEGLEAENKKQRIQAFHNFLVEFFMNPENEKVAQACGYEVHTGIDGIKHLRSTFSHRPFSLIDTEHMLCKIWLAIIHCHASRNISENKGVAVSHCYPLCEQGEWEAAMAPYSKKMWDGFRECCAQHPYPSMYMYEGQREQRADEQFHDGQRESVDEQMHES